MTLPKEYMNNEMRNNMYAGTDIYLAAGAAVWTAAMMHLFVMSVMHVYGVQLHQNVLYVAMALPALLSACNTLSTTGRPRERMYNAIASSLNIVFFTPITVPCQIAQSLTSGISITRNLFD